MASNITYTTIDAEYPQAGKANSTQGFRDNFDIIKTALETAKLEITDLQADTAKVTRDNDFNGFKLTNAELSTVWQSSAVFPDEVSGDVVVSWQAGSIQKYTVADDATVTFTFEDWPTAERAASIELWIQGAGSVGSTLGFAAAGTLLANVGTLAVDDTGVWVYRVQTIDAGSLILVTELGKHE